MGGDGLGPLDVYNVTGSSKQLIFTVSGWSDRGDPRLGVRFYCRVRRADSLDLVLVRRLGRLPGLLLAQCSRTNQAHCWPLFEPEATGSASALRLSMIFGKPAFPFPDHARVSFSKPSVRKPSFHFSGLRMLLRPNHACTFLPRRPLRERPRPSATQTIERDAYIVTYRGRRIPTAVAHERERRFGAKYMFEATSRWTIDGSSRRNPGRYINQSRRPDAEALLRKGRIVFVARRRIRPGEEITLDYGEQIFRSLLQERRLPLRSVPSEGCPPPGPWSMIRKKPARTRSGGGNRFSEKIMLHQ